MGATIVAMAVATAAQAMDVATFLAKGAALQARGAAAILTPEYREVQAELRSSTAWARRDRLRAIRSGRAPAYCPPEGASLSPEEVYAALLSVPVAQRARTQVRDVVRAAFVRKYPCPR